jgi:exopolysaccharide production protein ExoZ
MNGPASHVAGGSVIRNVQVLRAVAALLVVFIHLDTLLASLGLPVFGGGGVDVFFVISGFIMVYTTSLRDTGPWSFFADRIARIVPLYWSLTLALIVLNFVAPALLHSQATWRELIESLVFVPFEKPNGLIAPVLYVGWTLNYEMFFYLLFAGGLLLHNRRLGVATVVFCLVFLVAIGLVERPQGVIGRFYTSTILLEFAVGAVIGLAHREIGLFATTPLKVVAALVVLCGLGAAAVLPVLLPDISTTVARYLHLYVVRAAGCSGRRMCACAGSLGMEGNIALAASLG